MRKFLLVALVACGLSASAATFNALRIMSKNGSATTYLFDVQPELSFNGNVLVVTQAAQGSTASFELDDVDYYDFADVVSGVTAVDAASGITMQLSSSQATFQGVPQGAAVAVYTIDGRQVLATTATGGQVTIDAATVGGGVAVVRIGTFTTKIKF